jgi:hypothetical protein
MCRLVVIVLLLLLPVAADVGAVEVSFPMAVEVTISVDVTVPLAGGDLVIDDTFVLKGFGEASGFFAPPGGFALSSNRVDFRVSGGGVSAGGSVETHEFRFGEERSEAFFFLVTPLYQLDFGPEAGSANVSRREASFSAGGNARGVTVEGTSGGGFASFSGTGVAIPEPGTAVLLVLGAAAMGVWRGRGKIGGAARNTGALRRPPTISA